MIQLRFEETQGALLVTPLAAVLDAEVAPELRDLVTPMASSRALVVVSLAHVRSLDASALAALVSILKRMPPGGELRLVHAAPRVRSLLAATHLDEVFPLYEDASAAIAS